MSSEFGYGIAIDAGSSGSRIYLYRWPVSQQQQQQQQQQRQRQQEPRSEEEEEVSNSEHATTSFTKVEQEAIFSEERTPGINYKNDNCDNDGGLDHLGLTQLQELITLVQSALPSNVHPSSVPIYLGATAGMRIATIEENAAQLASQISSSSSSQSSQSSQSSTTTPIMDRVRSILHASPFQFHDEWARTISGEEEGVYDWLVANYLKNGGDFPTMDETTTYGALDLGGASTQISFPVMSNSALSNSLSEASSSSSSSSSSISRALSSKSRNVGRLGTPTSTTAMEEDHNRLPLLPLRIDNVEYPLFTQSFLYYGVDQARIRYDAEITASSSSDGNTELRTNPCYPTGYTDPNSNLAGTSNWEECFHSVADFFVEQTPNCSNNKGLVGGDTHNHYRCLLDGNHGVHDGERQQHQQQPPVGIDLSDRKFIAMSAFVYTWDYLNLTIGNDTDDLEALNASASRVCDMTHEEQMTRYHQLSMEDGRDDGTGPAAWKTDKPHAQCFNAAFTYHLLSKGYGLPVKRTPIEIYHDINGTKVQWALGLMLVEANKGGGSIFVGEDGGKWQQQLQDLQPLLRQLPRQQQQHHQLDVIGVGNTYKYLFVISTVVLVVLTWIFGRLPCFFRLKRASVEESCLPLVDPNAAMQNITPRKGR